LHNKLSRFLAFRSCAKFDEGPADRPFVVLACASPLIRHQRIDPPPTERYLDHRLLTVDEEIARGGRGDLGDLRL